jgi:hypothetical protein
LPNSKQALTLCYQIRVNVVNSLLMEHVIILGRTDMLRTITLGSTISVQGTYVRALPDGRIVVKVDNATYTGVPVTQAA